MYTSSCFTWMSLLTLFKLGCHVGSWNLWWHLPFCLKSTSCLSSLLYLHQRELCFLGSSRSSILKKINQWEAQRKLECERKSKVKVFSPFPPLPFPPPIQGFLEFPTNKLLAITVLFSGRGGGGGGLLLQGKLKLRRPRILLQSPLLGFRRGKERSGSLPSEDRIAFKGEGGRGGKKWASPTYSLLLLLS